MLRFMWKTVDICIIIYISLLSENTEKTFKKIKMTLNGVKFAKMLEMKTLNFQLRIDFRAR